METVMNKITFAGCTPTPLAGYLKALGVFRLVAEQQDAEVKACWQGERFALVTRLSREELTRFFLEEYKPTPILAPWNGGSGFYFQEGKLNEKDPLTGKKIKTGQRNQPTEATKTVATLLTSEAARFHSYRQVLQLGKDSVAKFKFIEAPKGDEKACFIQFIRSNYPDHFLPWLDAALVLTTDQSTASQLKSEFPPLLGTGGNDGNLDFTNNFMQRLIELFDPNTGGAIGMAPMWLDHALYASHAPHLAQNAIGQFAPGQIGGTNATTGFSTDSRINPWDFILMLEGALMFATVTTRRLESNQEAAFAYPFTVHPSNGGSGGTTATDAVTGKSRGEIWMPLWDRPASLNEIGTLFSEGRATVGRRAARDGLDFARAIGQLGTDRGIRAFQRYSFMVRNGFAYLATPLGRIEATRSPSVDLLTELDQGQFLERLRREARDKDAPASLKRAVAQLENALFALTQPGAGRASIQRALILLGDVMQTLALSRKEQDKIRQLPRLSAAWVIQAADDSAEFRLALALASLHRLRPYMAPVDRKNDQLEWAPESRLFVWGKGDLTRNLVRVVERRVIESRRDSEHDAFQSHARLGARLSDIQAFLSNQTDDGLIASLLHGLIWVDLPDELPSSTKSDGNRGTATTIPMAYATCKPFFTPPALLKHLERLPQDASFSLPGELPRLLAADQIDKAISLAWRRGQIAGLGWPQGDAPQAPSLSGPRLLAALAVPLRSTALLQLLPRAEDLQSESV